METAMPKAREVPGSLAPVADHGRPAARSEWIPPVTARCGDTTIAGFARTLSVSEALVEAVEPLPPLAGDCEVVFDLPLGRASARGFISEVNPESRTFRVRLEQLANRGVLLLAATLLAAGPKTSIA